MDMDNNFFDFSDLWNRLPKYNGTALLSNDLIAVRKPGTSWLPVESSFLNYVRRNFSRYSRAVGTGSRVWYFNNGGFSNQGSRVVPTTIYGITHEEWQRAAGEFFAERFVVPEPDSAGKRNQQDSTLLTLYMILGLYALPAAFRGQPDGIVAVVLAELAVLIGWNANDRLRRAWRSLHGFFVRTEDRSVLARALLGTTYVTITTIAMVAACLCVFGMWLNLPVQFTLVSAAFMTPYLLACTLWLTTDDDQIRSIADE